MEVLHHLRSSFRGLTSAANASSTSSLNATPASSMDSNNNNDAVSKKTGRHACDLCGKRFLKLAGWRNYFVLPCKCRHVFCKQCITGRLQCRQKVLRSASFNTMWTFPCPGSAQCGQQLTVDFSRGSSYSKNLMASDLESEDDDWEEDDIDVVDDGENIHSESAVSTRGGNETRVCETG